jgi:hypothetical protein
MMGETLWLFSFKTKMTYLKEWSILKMRAVGEATRCKVKVKVESGKSPDNNRAADDRLSRKSRKKKKKKNKERDFRSGSWDPGGGGGRGGEALRARAPRGQVPSALPPFPFSPSLPPEGGRTPTQLAESCIDRFQDFKFPLFHHRLFMERMSRLENAFSYSKDLHWSQNNLSF